MLFLDYNMYPNKKRTYPPYYPNKTTTTNKESNKKFQQESKKIEKVIECLIIPSEDGTTSLILEPIGNTLEGLTLYVGRAPEDGEDLASQQAPEQRIGA